MRKIRPLTAYKKWNPKIYEMICRFVQNIFEDDKKGTKSFQNHWYYIYAMHYGFYDTKSLLGTKYEGIVSHDKRNFYRMHTVTEIGRLALTGWYLGIEDFAREINQWVVKSWFRHHKTFVNFPDMEYARFLSDVRNNIEYWYQNKEDLKLKLVNEFFKDDIKHLLPEKTKIHKMLDALTDYSSFKGKSRIDLINEIRWWRDYAESLSERLDDYNIPYETEYEYNQRRNEMIKSLNKVYIKQQDEYSANVKFTLSKKANKLLK
jgi:hypothetical protein